MMRTACVCFTDRGAATAERIRAVLGKYETNRFTLFTKRRETASADGLFYIDDSLKEWTRQRFLDSDAILFVGACGIAVRSIAPFLVSKAEDPAVLVIDETGSWVISLVSGHLGGANALAREIAAGISAQPVLLTTLQRALDDLYEHSGIYFDPGLPKTELVRCRFGSEANQVGAYLYYES